MPWGKLSRWLRASGERRFFFKSLMMCSCICAVELLLISGLASKPIILVSIITGSQLQRLHFLLLADAAGLS